MDPSERFDYIVSIFSEGSLRRFSDYLDADISIMTIHSAKGLEWDTVFIPGVTLRLAWKDLFAVRKCWHVLAFCARMPDCGCEEIARRAY
ncbi:MAG: 3'-5' exonuclease [Collinsella sp.]